MMTDPVKYRTISNDEKKRIKMKIDILKGMRNAATTKAVEYMLKYEKLKKKDERIDLLNSFLSSGVIALSITSIPIPPLIFASIGMSSLGLIINSLHKTSKIKMKIERHSITSKQWGELAREISTVLVRNNMSSLEYSSVIESFNQQIGFIEDASL